MKKIFFTILLSIPFLGYTQDDVWTDIYGTNTLLTEKNGFKDIKLGSNVTDYDFITKCKDFNVIVKFQTNEGQVASSISPMETAYNVKECEYWEVSQYNKKHMTFGNGIDINKIYIETYKNIIFNISIWIDNPRADRKVPQILLSVFGTEGHTDMFNEDSKGVYGIKEKELNCSHQWSGDNVHIGVQSYHSYPMGYNISDKRRISWLVQYSNDMRREIDDLGDEITKKEKEAEELELRDKF